jgi:hypothetical protein
MTPEPNPPAFAVRISPETVRHIDNQHVQDSAEHALWAEFLSSTGDLARALTPEIERPLQRPFFVEYDQFDPAGGFLHRTRECVTRSGIVAVIRVADEHSGDLTTAFFPYETLAARPRRRWLEARNSRLRVYGCRVTYGLARSLIVSPTADDEFPSADPPGFRRNVIFLTHAHWGIRSVEIEGTTYLAFGNPPPWPEPV